MAFIGEKSEWVSGQVEKNLNGEVGEFCNRARGRWPLWKFKQTPLDSLPRIKSEQRNEV